MPDTRSAFHAEALILQGDQTVRLELARLAVFNQLALLRFDRAGLRGKFPSDFRGNHQDAVTIWRAAGRPVAPPVRRP